MVKHLTLGILSLFSCALGLRAESADTITQLREVVVSEKASRPSAAPKQSLGIVDIKRMAKPSLADALRLFSGVQIKDYGGLGGIKTVDVRSMGSQHTAVVYDGMEIGNAQNGQVDLGQFSLDNIQDLNVYNGQRDKLLLPAKEYGTAAAVHLNSRRPQFTGDSRFNLRAALRSGSFGLINPALNAEWKASRRISLSASTELLSANGQYPFRYRKYLPNGSVAYDTTATRHNGDITSVRSEINVFGTATRGDWQLKAFNFLSDRGLPGPIVNNVWRRGERQQDANTFVQASKNTFMGPYSSALKLKYAHYRTFYQNDHSTQVPQDNRYIQHQAYFSTANTYAFSPALSAALSYDLEYGTMSSNLHGFRQPHRWTNLIAAATNLSLSHLQLKATLLGTFVNDIGKDSRHALSPALYLVYRPLETDALSIRSFAKRSFRMPTFNDLYYTTVSSAYLKPESATQYNIGASTLIPTTEALNISLSADAYYNSVADKIIAYPQNGQFRWTMMNMGLVRIIGLDSWLSAALSPSPNWDCRLRLQYTYQNATDRTAPTARTYGHQIPYVPRHSAAALLSGRIGRYTAAYTYNYTGARYGMPENTLPNRMAPWQTSDIAISTRLASSAVEYNINAEINNIFDADYDIIQNYPMPKRNFRIGLSIKW